MARVSKTVEVCDRDAFGKEKEATTSRRFAVEGSNYLLRLCEEHARMFDREMFGWSRLAKEEASPFASQATFTSEYRERALRAAELRAAQSAAELDHDVPHFDEPEDVLEVSAGNVFVLDETEQIKAGERTRSGWMFTPHAIERAELRGYTLLEALDAAVNPHITYADRGHLPGRRVHQHAECAVVVNTERKIVITVLHRDEAKYALEHHHSLSERIAT